MADLQVVILKLSKHGFKVLRDIFIICAAGEKLRVICGERTFDTFELGGEPLCVHGEIVAMRAECLQLPGLGLLLS